MKRLTILSSEDPREGESDDRRRLARFMASREEIRRQARRPEQRRGRRHLRPRPRHEPGREQQRRAEAAEPGAGSARRHRRRGAPARGPAEGRCISVFNLNAKYWYCELR